MQPRHGQLTPRENDVLAALMDGNTTYVEIAAAMNLDTKTIQTYLGNIYAMTGCKNMTALALWCMRNGFEVMPNRQRRIPETCFNCGNPAEIVYREVCGEWLPQGIDCKVCNPVEVKV